MDLSVFNKYREYQSDTEREFNPSLRTDNHEDPDIHLIGESVPSPSIISTIGAAASVGTSPIPAREDHAHGYTPYSLPLAATTPNACSTVAGAVGTSTSVARADHVHRYTDTVYTHPSSITLTTLTVTSNSSFGGQLTANTIKANPGYGITGGGGAYFSGGANAVVATDHYGTNFYGGTHHGNCLANGGSPLGLSAPSNYVDVNNWMRYIGPPAGAYFNVTWNAANSIIYINTSTRDIKENIESIAANYASSVIDKLDPVSFIYKRHADFTPESEEWRKKEIKHGFIAEDVAEVDVNLALWDLVRDEEGNDLGTGELIPRSYSETSILAVAIAELKSLRIRVASLEEQLRGKASLDAK